MPQNEAQRLEDLYSYGILDTPAESDFDQLTELATLICGCDMSLVTIVDRERVWFKAKKGVDFPESPRELSMCSHVILQEEVMVIDDPLTDERFFDLPGVVTDPNVRFYAGAPIRSANGFHLGTVCVFDSTPKHITDNQINALSRLARQASVLLEFRKRNEELKLFAEEQLQLKQLAQIASRSQKQFLSTMSHEIRTPLNGVIGMTNLLLLEEPSPQQVEYLTSLKFASETLLTVVNDVLDYNKITSEVLSFENVPFHLYQRVRQIVQTHALTAKNKGVSIELTTDPQVPEWVTGDSARLTQVLNNLIGNALKFTQQGSVKIRLQLADTTADGVAIRFDVTDSGIGIEESQQEAIFEQFTQANSGITRQFGGTGLGLSITKKLLEQQGATIQVKSKPGEGATFFFTLSFGRCQDTATPRLPTAETAGLAGLKVLIVEDNKINWVVLRKYLSAWKVESELAENGAIAIQKIATGHYDLVFMDLQMPVMDGFAATQKLREEYFYTKPIVAITADAFAGQDNNLQGLGFTDSIVKPFDRNELAQKLVSLTKPAATQA